MCNKLFYKINLIYNYLVYVILKSERKTSSQHVKITVKYQHVQIHDKLLHNNLQNRLRLTLLCTAIVIPNYIHVYHLILFFIET